jgi:hypothetical protein
MASSKMVGILLNEAKAVLNNLTNSINNNK